jgi:hypothetical protein
MWRLYGYKVFIPCAIGLSVMLHMAKYEGQMSTIDVVGLHIVKSDWEVSQLDAVATQLTGIDRCLPDKSTIKLITVGTVKDADALKGQIRYSLAPMFRVNFLANANCDATLYILEKGLGLPDSARKAILVNKESADHDLMLVANRTL